MMSFIFLIVLFQVNSFKLNPSFTKKGNRFSNCNPLSSVEEGDMVFYPDPQVEIDSRMSDDEILYNTFLKQISDLSSDTDYDDGYAPEEYLGHLKSIHIIPNKRLVETISMLESNTPIEIVYKKRLMFANYLKKREGTNSILVRLVYGDIVHIDIGQVVSCWDYLSNDIIPDNPVEWANVAAEALEILGNMSPRKSDLQEFWTITGRRSLAIPVDSLDLAVYIFQERRFRVWIDPLVTSDDAAVYAVSAAQRYAAALLLFNDEHHFKRIPSRSATNQLEDEDAVEDLEELGEDGMYIIEGGYKVLDESTKVFREVDVFSKYYKEKINQIRQESESGECKEEVEEPFRAGCLTRQLRALELYALSAPSTPPPAAVRHILKKLDRAVSPAGAKSVLKEMQHSSSSVSGGSETGKAVRTPSTVTPWTSSQLQEALLLYAETVNARKRIAEAPVSRAGKRGYSGRFDYREGSQAHPAICVDSKSASFLDDAFSLSPETGEILVHVVDVAGILRRFPVLQDTAKDRISSTFLPTGPLHMLPPAALEGLKLSTNGPNEVITVALTIDSTTGSLLGSRIFPSIIGPVAAIDVQTADEILAGVGVADMDKPGQERSSVAGYSNEMIRDLLRTNRIVSKVISAQPWVDVHFSQSTAKQVSIDKRTGVYEQSSIDKTPANRLVNALLTMYSNASFEYCASQGVNVPLAWESRDRIVPDRVRRFATQPLRNWLAQLQQKQLRAALSMELPLSRKDCAMAVSHHNSRRKQTSALRTAATKGQSLFESFEAHCARLEAYCKQADSGTQPVLIAVGTGRAGVVRLKGEFNGLEGTLDRSVSVGEEVRVIVKKIVPETKTVVLSTAL